MMTNYISMKVVSNVSQVSMLTSTSSHHGNDNSLTPFTLDAHLLRVNVCK